MLHNGSNQNLKTGRVTSMAWVSVQGWAFKKMDSLAERRRREPGGAAHLATGERGEREALFHLRTMGYTIVARRWKSAKLWGDVDLVGWDGKWLCFVEVKTRRGRDGMTAESAVDREKQEMLRRMARAYLRGFPEKLRGDIAVRFDVVSVYLLPTGVEFDLYQSAFGW
jgi:putative endonuclease